MDFKSLGEQFAEVQKEDDELAQQLSKKLREYQEKRPIVLARAHEHIDDKGKQLAKMEDGLNRLSNAIPTKEGE